MHGLLDLPVAGHHFRKAQGDVIQGKARLALDAPQQLRTQGLLQGFALPGVQSVCECPIAVDVEDDVLRVALLDQLAQQPPLFVADQFRGGTGGGQAGGAICAKDSALTGSTEGQPLHRTVVAAREDVDGTPARCEGRG